MSGLIIDCGIDWGTSREKVSGTVVQPIPGATLHWSVAQLIPAAGIATWFDRVNEAALVAPPLVSQRPSVYQSTRKVVRFNGVNQRLDYPLNASTVRTILFVGRFGTSIANTFAFTGGQGPSFNLYIGGNGKFAFAGGSDTGGLTLSHSLVGDTSTHVFLVTIAGASSVINIDGVEVVGSLNPPNATALRLAATSTGYSSIDCEELAFLPYAADTAERADIVARAKKQYGIA